MPFAERFSTTDGAVPEFAITHMPPRPSLHMPLAAVVPGIRSFFQAWPSKWPSLGTSTTFPATQTLDRDNASTCEYVKPASAGGLARCHADPVNWNNALNGCPALPIAQMSEALAVLAWKMPPATPFSRRQAVPLKCQVPAPGWRRPEVPNSHTLVLLIAVMPVNRVPDFQAP